MCTIVDLGVICILRLLVHVIERFEALVFLVNALVNICHRHDNGGVVQHIGPDAVAIVRVSLWSCSREWCKRRDDCINGRASASLFGC